MTVKDLIEKLQTVPQDAKVLHINYQLRKEPAFSTPYICMNGQGELILGAYLVGSQAPWDEKENE